MRPHARERFACRNRRDGPPGFCAATRTRHRCGILRKYPPSSYEQRSESASLEAFTAWIGAVAGHAFGRVGVAVFRGLAMNAGFESLHFVGMTLRAFAGNQLFRGRQFVHAAVTRSARGFSQDGVGAGREGLGLVRMACRALHFGDSCGMREFLDGDMAVFAAENRVSAGSMFRRIDGNVFSGVRTSFPPGHGRRDIPGPARAKPVPAHQENEKGRPASRALQHPSPHFNAPLL